MCSKNPDVAKDTSEKPYNSCSLSLNLNWIKNSFHDYNNGISNDQDDINCNSKNVLILVEIILFKRGTVVIGWN